MRNTLKTWSLVVLLAHVPSVLHAYPVQDPRGSRVASRIADLRLAPPVDTNRVSLDLHREARRESKQAQKRRTKKSVILDIAAVAGAAIVALIVIWKLMIPST